MCPGRHSYSKLECKSHFQRPISNRYLTTGGWKRIYKYFKWKVSHLKIPTVYDPNILEIDLKFYVFRYCLGILKTNDSSSYPVVAVFCQEICSDLQCRLLTYTLDTLKMISIFMLLVTICIYMVLRKLRDLQGSCILNFLLCYVFVYTILHDVVRLNHPGKFDTTCPSIG